MSWVPESDLPLVEWVAEAAQLTTGYTVSWDMITLTWDEIEISWAGEDNWGGENPLDTPAWTPEVPL